MKDREKIRQQIDNKQALDNISRFKILDRSQSCQKTGRCLYEALLHHTEMHTPSTCASCPYFFEINEEPVSMTNMFDFKVRCYLYERIKGIK